MKRERERERERERGLCCLVHIKLLIFCWGLDQRFHAKGRSKKKKEKKKTLNKYLYGINKLSTKINM